MSIDILIYSALMGLTIGVLTYSTFIKSLDPYQRVYYTETFTGFKLELALLLLPSILTGMSGTIAIFVMGAFMSVAMSVSELVFANIHSGIPSVQRKRCLYFSSKYNTSIKNGIRLAKQWETANGK